MVPVNTPQSSWWGGQLMWAQRWIGAWGTAPVAAREGVRAGWAGRDTPKLEGKYKPKCQIYLRMALPLTNQNHCASETYTGEFWQSCRCGSGQNAGKLPVAQLDKRGQCQGRSCTSLCEKFGMEPAPRWVHIHHGKPFRAPLLLAWREAFKFFFLNHIMNNNITLFQNTEI